MKKENYNNVSFNNPKAKEKKRKDQKSKQKNLRTGSNQSGMGPRQNLKREKPKGKIPLREKSA